MRYQSAGKRCKKVGWAMNASHGKDEVPAHHRGEQEWLTYEIPF
jgi:hypothetical protein